MLPSADPPTSPAVDEQEDGPDPDVPKRFWLDGEMRWLKSELSWKLLHCLYPNRDDWVEFMEIGEAVWGKDATANATIRSAISRLNADIKSISLPLHCETSNEKALLKTSSNLLQAR